MAQSKLDSKSKHTHPRAARKTILPTRSSVPFGQSHLNVMLDFVYGQFENGHERRA
jgi:hypothetical protein